jgi:hypothetical protein
MGIKMKNMKFVPLSMLAFAISFRVLPHPANFAPIAAIALFSGSHFDSKTSLVLPLIAMFVSDLVIGFYGPTMFLVYLSFILISLIGNFLKNHKSLRAVISATFFSSILFYLLTNLGVWIFSPMYTKDISGLIQCYVAALPFFRNTLLGDAFYVTLFFGSYELLARVSKKHLPKNLHNLAF